jgi:hypothetical protein
MAKIKAQTLLRKIQKNGGKSLLSAEARSKLPSFSFDQSGRIQVFKRREIVKPYLHPIDSRIINESVERTVKQNLRGVDPEIEKNYEKFLPKHLVNDIYSLYYNSSDKMKFESLNRTNKIKFDIMDSINNSLIKIVTNGSHISSHVYAEEISKFLYKKFMTLPPEQQKQLQQSLDNCNQGGDGEGDENDEDQGGQSKGKGGNKNGQGKGGKGKQDRSDEEDEAGDQAEDGTNKGGERPDEDVDGDSTGNTDPNAKSSRNEHTSAKGPMVNASGNSKTDMSQKAQEQMARDLEKMVENMLQNKQSQKELEQAFKDAEKKLDHLKEIGVNVENDEEMPEEEKREIIANLNNLDSIRRSLLSLRVSKDKVMKAIEKILNKSSNYFSQKCITTDVELFEADQLLDINGIEFLHPIFSKSRLFDLSVTERKYIGKIDLYVDCSGSMSAGCGGDLNGVTRIDLAKALAMQMKELGILGELYEFEGRPKKIMNTDISILMMAARGGTDIEAVLQNILKTGNNSVILSDGESWIQTYTEKAIFVGVGTDFSGFKYDNCPPGQEFIYHDQCITYNGKDFEVVKLPSNAKRNQK